ncbi:MAG: preprotein translocase subunit SecE [Candidatus Bathyarchaeota archaeon]
MGLKTFFQSASRLLKLATKPGRTELWLSIKICFLGVVAIGGIGFVIQLIGSII